MKFLHGWLVISTFSVIFFLLNYDFVIFVCVVPERKTRSGYIVLVFGHMQRIRTQISKECYKGVLRIRTTFVRMWVRHIQIRIRIRILNKKNE